MFRDLTANYLADMINTIYKSFQTDKRKGIKTELKPIMKKILRSLGK